MKNTVNINGTEIEVQDISINGLKLNLSPEQMEYFVNTYKRLQAHSFERRRGNKYYYIDATGVICRSITDDSTDFDDAVYEAGNYCTDKALLEQRALQERLTRNLWRYSMMNGGDLIDISKGKVWYITYNHFSSEEFNVECSSMNIYPGVVYFISKEVAYRAIKDIVLPFIKVYPEFRWC